MGLPEGPRSDDVFLLFGKGPNLPREEMALEADAFPPHRPPVD
jgi:hypothetical protein